MVVAETNENEIVRDLNAVPRAACGQRRLRVLSVLNKLVWAGHEQRLHQLAASIDRVHFDHRVLVMTAPQFEDEAQERATGSMRHAFAEIGFPVDDLGEPQDSVAGRVGLRRALTGASGITRAIRKLVQYIRQNEIDVIDAHHTSAVFAASIAGRLTGVPVIISAYHVEPWKPLVMRLPGQLAFANAAAIVTDSLARADDIRTWMWNKSVPIEVIPTGVPIPVATRSGDAVRKELGLHFEPGDQIIGQVSGRIPCKGHDVLIEAIPRVLASYPNCRFLCVGFSRSYHDYERQLEARVAELGLQERVLFRAYPGPIGDVWQLFDVLVHPSKFDSLPLSILEAMAVGKPIVSTSVGGIPEVITHEENGLLVEPNRVDSLASGLVRMLSDQVLAQRLGVAAQVTYQTQLTPSVMARALECVYERFARRD